MRLSSKGLDLIKEFEGLELTAYRCPANILTIGYGHTGSDVKEGLTITEEQANRYLASDTESAQQCVSSFVVAKLNQNEYDALVSFTFNVGPTAFINSTLLKLLNEGVTRVVVSAEFLRWVKAGGEEASPGLVRRREAERKLFLEKVKHPLLSKSILARQDTWLKRRPIASNELKPEEKLFVPKDSAWQWTELRMYAGENHQKVFLTAEPAGDWWIFPDHWKIINDVEKDVVKKPTAEIKLAVPYYSQRDNYKDPMRTCYSSSCAMMLSGLDPEAINIDDEYIKVVYSYGDTTEASSQLKALKDFGISASFVQTGTWSDIESLLQKGIPVPIGILHKGPVTAPTGGGHWICCIGVTADRKNLIVHDPFGDLDLVSGGYISSDGKSKLYSKKNLGPRWMVTGDKSGWYIKGSK